MHVLKVVLTAEAKKDLLKTPVHIVRKLQAWIENIEHEGLYSTRKIPGFHDEPLKGKRSGQRSIRLSKAYRAIYVLDKDERIEIVKILEVNKHEY